MGRLILIKSILKSILVYWTFLVNVPKFILDRITHKCFTFLGIGKKDKMGTTYKLGKIRTTIFDGGMGFDEPFQF